MLALFLFSAAVSVYLFKLSKNREFTKKVLLVIAAVLVLALGTELSVFNVNFYLTKGYEEISLERYLKPFLTEDGTYEFTEESSVLYLNELNAEVKNIRFDAVYDTERSTDLKIRLTDDGNKYLFEVPQRTLNPGVKKSQVININTSGITKNATVTFMLDEGETLTLKSAYINVKRDFDFSFIRVFFFVMIAAFIYLFKPSSPLYKLSVEKNADLLKSFCTSVIIIECGIIVTLSSLNPTLLGIASKHYNQYAWSGSGIDFISLRLNNHNQYDQLAKAFLDGKVYIDDGDIPDFLSEMDNPYDTVAREYETALTGESARWDVAYYNNHYYVYFGIVPLLLLYLPFRILFDAPFPTAVGIAIYCILFSVGSYLLLSFFAKKKFKGMSIGAFSLVYLVFINCSGMLFFAKRPDFYSLPIIMSMTFSVFGIFCWLKALEKEKTSLPLFFTGSLLMALVAGSRPQMTLLSFVSLPLFWRLFFNKERHILKKRGIRELASLGAPYILVAAGLMYYNFIRFGSPFDFGANYNLTTNDMTVRGFEFGRIGLGLFTYLFQLPAFSATFPFIKSVSITSNYAGKTIYENCFGGAFWSASLLWALAFLPKVKDVLKEKKLFAFSLISAITAFVIVLVDTQGAGLLQRYFGDFLIMLLLPASLVIFALYEKYRDARAKKAFNTALFVSSAWSAFYMFCLVFSVSDMTINTQNPVAFTYLSEAFQFWL